MRDIFKELEEEDEVEGEGETLTEEQREVLAWVSSANRELSQNYKKLFRYEIYDDSFNPFDNTLGECEINNRLEEVGLPKIHFTHDSCNIPADEDYYSVLSDEEREQWEKKAEKYNKEGKERCVLSGYQVWEDESGEYERFIEAMEGINRIVENYLFEINQQYGTNY
jgi:hypothetical protein